MGLAADFQPHFSCLRRSSLPGLLRILNLDCNPVANASFEINYHNGTAGVCGRPRRQVFEG